MVKICCSFHRYPKITATWLVTIEFDKFSKDDLDQSSQKRISDILNSRLRHFRNGPEIYHTYWIWPPWILRRLELSDTTHLHLIPWYVFYSLCHLSSLSIIFIRYYQHTFIWKMSIVRHSYITILLPNWFYERLQQYILLVSLLCSPSLIDFHIHLVNFLEFLKFAFSFP